MAQKTNIQWTDATWNIARGCTKVDEDCKYCYMYRDSFDGKRYNPREVIRTKTVFNFPLRYKAEKSECWGGRPLIFTSSLTDWGHEKIDGYRSEMWQIIRACPQFIFQLLTKRTERLSNILPDDWGEGYENVWLGTSVGSNKGMKRAYELLSIPAATRFISFEPLHENLHLYLDLTETMMFDWVIVGGESGHDTGLYRYRRCQIDWVENIVSHFSSCGVPVFVKQLGTWLSKEMKMSDRHGSNINEFPKYLRLREFPKIEK